VPSPRKSVLRPRGALDSRSCMWAPLMLLMKSGRRPRQARVRLVQRTRVPQAP
jgi:hypothetical protein